MHGCAVELRVVFYLVFLGVTFLCQPAWCQFVTLLPANDEESSLPQLLVNGTDGEPSRLQEAFSIECSKVNDKAFSLEISSRVKKPLMLKGWYVEKVFGNSVNLSQLGKQRGAVNIRFDSSLANGYLDMYGQFGFGAFDPEIAHGIDEGQRRYDVGFKGKLGHFSYGTRHGSTGREHNFLIKGDYKGKLKPGKAVNEIWGAWRYNKIGIKTSFSEVWNNLENNPNKPRIITTQGGITLSYRLSSWPYLGYSLSYFQGTRQSSHEPVNYKPHQDPIEKVAMGLSYSGNVWNASLYSSYSRTKDSPQAGKLPTATWTYDLRASYYPTRTLRITPALGYYIKDYSQFDTQTITRSARSASTTFSYAPKNKNYKFKVFSSYNAVTNRTWGQDTENFYLDNALVWSLPGSSPLEMKNLSLHATYNRYRDAINSDSDSDNVAVWLVFSIQPPSGLRLMPASLFGK